MVYCNKLSKFFLILKLSYVYCTYPYVHCWIHNWEQGVYFKENLFLLCQEIVISYSMMTNLSMDIWAPFVVHHKWYGFDPKTKKKGNELEHQKTIKNVSMHQENDRKDPKNHQFWVFSTSLNTISNVLNFLGVVLGVSRHSLSQILLTLSSTTAYEPSWMSPTLQPSLFLQGIC
jgi:hypothetical protein